MANLQRIKEIAREKNISLSDTAEKFARVLKVKVLNWNIEYSDRGYSYPPIKCNINNGDKIYHLPFDQQYDRTQIKNEGEFYAWSVDEAVKKGFRRVLDYVFQ